MAHYPMRSASRPLAAFLLCTSLGVAFASCGGQEAPPHCSIGEDLPDAGDAAITIRPITFVPRSVAAIRVFGVSSSSPNRSTLARSWRTRIPPTCAGSSSTWTRR